MNVTLELFIDRRWHRAGVFSPDEHTVKTGISGSGTFEYDVEYTVERLADRPH